MVEFSILSVTFLCERSCCICASFTLPIYTSLHMVARNFFSKFISFMAPQFLKLKCSIGFGLGCSLG